MKIKSCLRGIGLWVAALTLIVSPCLVHAACEIVGTIDGGYIVACTGTDTDGFCIGAGNDIITVETGAEVSNTVQQWVEAIASANAIAIDAGGGNNRVTNHGSIGAAADADALPKVQTASQATANATGISAGDGSDVVQNYSTIAATATSNSESGDISLTLEGNNQFQGTTTSTAAAKGIDVGGGNNQVINTGAIATMATSEADASFINVDMGDSGGADVRTIANASAAGISGGNGEDEIITGEGTITVNAAANVNSANALVTIDVANESLVTGSSLSDASVMASAKATGIDGGEGDDTIVNDETEISADANADATAVGVSLLISGSLEGNIEGEALSNSSTNADATATGIDGGGGNDTIENRGKISANADSKATAVGVGVGITVANEGSASGAALSDASVMASATATGIDGGEGSDAIDNRGDIELLANSDATGVSVAVDVAGTMKGSAAGSSVSDASVTAEASAIGIDGGAGDDTIVNEGSATTTNATASATGVSVGLTVSGSMKGNVAGKALSDASVTANAAATGIDGGSGQDTIDNWSNLSSEVDASATGVAVSLKVGFSKEGDVSPNAVAEGSALSNASVTASATATGIDGGEDSDAINNRGDIDLLANSDATGVSVAVDVAGTMKGSAAGSSVSNSSVTAKSAAIGIAGGAGDDTITNEGTITLMKQAEGIDQTDASATAVSVGLTVTGSMEGNVEGRALSDASGLADAAATGISGGAGIDAITNSGAIVAEVDSKATAVGVSVGVTLSKEGSASGAALSNASVTASAAATGIDGGGGDDTIESSGDIDLLANSDATGVSVSVDVAGTMKGSAAGSSVSNSSVTAKSTAIGITGGEGDDTITNEGTITLMKQAAGEDQTDASTTAVSVGLTVTGSMEGNVEGRALSDASALAAAAATGISGGAGIDAITNRGAIVAEVDSEATAVGVSVGVTLSKEGSASGGALSNASVTAKAAATGIDGGDGDDTIENRGDIDLLANSDATGVSVSVVVAGSMKGEARGEAQSDASVTAKSTVIGITGGAGDDTIVNEGTITLMKQSVGEDEVDAKALGVAVSLNITGSLNGTAEGQALSKATTTAEATATGISGGSGLDNITNRAAITADVDSHAEGVAVAANVSVSGNGVAEGGSLSDVSTVAKAKATGIDGGEDDDTIDNSGEIQLFSNANATSTAVSVTVSGTLRGQAGGEALSKASTTADATATGIAGGDGADKITNRSMIVANVESDANAVAVAANISVTGQGNAVGAALSDSSSTASASASGIDGGADDDIIDNKGAINLLSFSDAQATAVSVGLAGSMRGMAEGKSVADSSAEAIAQSIGIDGGEGNDRISSSENPITTFARSLSNAESVSVQGTGAVGMAKGAAVADSSASSVSYSAGIDGGLGNDTIENASEIKATAKADAEASSTTVGVTIGLGAADTVGTGDSSATARAIATGIEGGEGNDRIENTATITAGGLENQGPMANAQAGATTVTVGLALGLNMGQASSNASAVAEADAIGISSGSGDDWIYNAGDITVGPDPMGTGSMASTSAKSTTVKVDVTLGASLGESSSDTSSTAVANAAGIRSGSGNDWVYNTGAITVGTDPYDPGKPDAMAKAKAASETVDVGITIGGSFRDASSNASATAVSTVKGIETDQGNDWISNSGSIKVFSSSEAVGLAKTTKVGLTVGVSEGGAQSDASSLSRALATGIDSGGDADEILTDSELTVKARSKATAISTARDYNILSVGAALQSAVANSSSTAEAIARGIDGGTGGDTITAGGVLDITADTEVKSTSRSSTVTGVSIGLNVQEAQSRAETIANSLAIGIDGGEGNDAIYSTAAITLNSISNASTQAISATNTGFNIAGSSSGESVANAATNVTATGIGIRGGASELAIGQTDADVIINEGPISVTTTVSATTQSTSTADSTTFIGAATGKAVSDASAQVLAVGIGIDGGDDNDTITNKNTLTVKTKADSSVKSTSNVDSDVTFGGASSIGVSDASANVWAEATGMAGGSGDDVITSLAPVTVEAESIGSVTANSYVDAAVTFGGASSKAASDASATKKAIARGIDGGDGDDVIANYDTLNVRAISAGTVTSESRAKAKAIFGSTSSLTTTAAALEGAVDAAGIIGGSGDDRIKNLGNVNSIADATLIVENSSVATAKSTFGSSDARAFSVSTAQGKASSIGISGDDGNDLIENEGVVNASAIANTNIKSTTVAIARSTFGSEFTVAASTNYAAGESTSKGITAGAGDDKIVNKGLVTVEAGGTVKVDSITVSSDGPAYSDAGTLALAYAKGVDGGAGDDDILNTDTVFVKATPRILSATRTFGSGGNVDGKVGILLNAAATGITGGEGKDAIRNEGNILVLVGGQETGSTVSEDAVSGSTTITDNSFTTPADPKELVGKWIRITGGENPDFFTQVVAFDPQTGTFTLRDSLKYDLSTGTAYTLYDYGVKEPDITSVNVTVGGRTRVDASTTASVQARGMVGGDGNDRIVNAGTTAVSASNLVKTVELSVTRNIVADTRIESTVNAVGIEGNDQSSVTDVSDGGTNVFTDLSRKGEDPEAIVGKPVLFKSGSSTDFATLVESFDPDTGTFTLAAPLPSGGLSRGDIYTLGGGSDSITNLGAIDIRADSAIDASRWSLSFGSADIEGKGRAQAISAGIRGGESNDSFQNYGGISTRSTAEVSSTDRVYVVFGSADQKLSFEASSKSVGVDAGAGNDEFTNAGNSSINTEAVSTANVDGVTAALFASIKNSVNAIADSTALGLDLGQGNNVAYNEGELQVSANAVVTAKAISNLDLFGETDADADAIAKAFAWGIRAGSGEDQVFNYNLIQVDASADATSFAQGSKVGSTDDTSTVTEDSSAGSYQIVDASLEDQDPQYLVGKWVRFLTGENEDFFTRIVGLDPSSGTITIFDELPGDLKAAVLDADGNVITPADEYTFSAARDGTSASVASALATGIDLGDGNAIVENTGVIRVKASAKADTTARASGGQVTAQANSSSEARGIRTGTGDDVIRNAGVIDVESEVVTRTSGGSATEIATATGIDAGNGNNKITNEGLINVTASVAQPNGEAKARGIITGEGDDTIINSGEIISSTVINGTRELGIGIATGAGNDMVTLDQGTLVEGSINLGEGNDTLAFAGNPMVIGEVTGGSGTDSLMFEGAGSVGFGLSDFEIATKKGPGTFTVASLTTMQRVEVDEGTLEINDDYQMAESGTFQTKVYGGGDCGQLKINGEAGLAGTLKVIKGPGAYVNGTKYNVLVADTTTDWFSDEIMPATVLVSFRANGYDDRVEVESLVKSFATVANNRVHKTIGRYMDKILPTASGDLSEVLGEFQNLSGPEFNTAFSSLSPDSYDNYTRGTLFSAQQYSKSLQYRMNNVRYHLMAGSPDDEKPILLAYSGSDASLGQLFTPGQLSQIQGKNGLWLDAFGQWGDQDEEDGYTGYDYFMRGATLGFDHRMMDNLMAGLSLGYSRSDIDLDRNQGSGIVKSLFGSLYGSYFDKHLYIDAILSYGRNWYDNSRIITIGGISRRATSEHDAHLFSTYLGGGYYFDFNPWSVGPYGSLQYIRLDEESFEEKGAGGISLRVDDRQTDSLTSELGLRMVRLLKGKYGNFLPEVSLAWSHDFDIDDHVVKASFAGSPGASFSIDGQDVERNGLILGAGLTFIHKSGLSTSFRYKGEFREGYKSNGVMGEIRYSF